MIVVFVGPSLDVTTAQACLEARYLPPVANGDVVRAVAGGAEILGIIDGYFEWTLAVWHKEILWALGQGTHVFGAASMGALRAVELAPFGMRGVGRIFELYRDGMLEDDDEVVVIHEAGGSYAPASEAMINIRCTLLEASRANVITDGTRRRLETLAKRLFYPDRRYDRVLAVGRQRGLPARELDDLEAWLPANRVDQKRADALQLMRELRELQSRSPGAFQPKFALAHSGYFDELLTRAGVTTPSGDARTLPAS